MHSHELADILLAIRGLPVATHALGHTYMSGIDSFSHGIFKVGLLETYGGPHIIIGDLGDRVNNEPNWYISKMFHGNIGR